MRTVLIAGPRDGVEVEAPAGRSYIKIPLHEREGGGVAVYRLATITVAGTPVCGVFVWEAALRAIGRLYLAGALR